MGFQTALFCGFGGRCFLALVCLLVFEVLYQWGRGYFLSLRRWLGIFFLGRCWVGQALQKVHEFWVEVDRALTCIGAAFSTWDAGVGCVFEGGGAKEAWVCESLCCIFKGELADVVRELG